MLPPAIVAESLTKEYRGKDDPAISNLNLTVSKGELFGFLGPNGAGKTTTIRILMTLLRPTNGRALVAGHDVLKEPLEAMRHVGFMPENPGFYASLSGRQHLVYWAKLYGLSQSQPDGRVDTLLRQVGLSDAAERKAKAYSYGMRRRLAIAGALLPDPEIIILDEPSLGLDPEGMAFVRSLLRQLHEEGRTIFLSSHLLGEVEKLCTRVGVLHRGRLLRVDAPRTLVQLTGERTPSLEIDTKGVRPSDLEEIRKIGGVSGVSLDGTILRIHGSLNDDMVAEINRRLVSLGVLVIGFHRIEASLEEAFLALTRQDE